MGERPHGRVRDPELRVHDLSDDGSNRSTSQKPMPPHGEGNSSLGTIVVKIGGSTLGEHDTTMRDLVTLQRRGARVAVVHGGGKIISQWMERHGLRPRFVRGMRVTDAASMEIVTAVLAGLVNKQLVADIHRAGGKAMGLSCADGGMVRCTLQDPALGLVGAVSEVDAAAVTGAVDAGYVPVIAPVAAHVDDGSENAGALLNVNADIIAGELAAAMGAERLTLLTDVEGVLMPGRGVISRLTARQAEGLIRSSLVGGGMTPKLQACVTAVTAGAGAHITDGRRGGALLDSVADAPVGTRVG